MIDRLESNKGESEVTPAEDATGDFQESFVSDGKPFEAYAQIDGLKIDHFRMLKEGIKGARISLHCGEMCDCISFFINSVPAVRAAQSSNV